MLYRRCLQGAGAGNLCQGRKGTHEMVYIEASSSPFSEPQKAEHADGTMTESSTPLTYHQFCHDF